MSVVFVFFFNRHRKRFLKFIWKHKESEIVKPIFRNKNKARSLTLPDFKTFYKGIVIKTLWRWHKDTFGGQWNRREIPEINPYMYGQLIFHKGGKKMQWREDCTTSKWGRKGRQPYARQ